MQISPGQLALPAPIDELPDGDVKALEGELYFGTALVARRPIGQVQVQIEFRREATQGDLDLLAARNPARGLPMQTLLHVKHSHHQLARVLACGSGNIEASGLTGYSPGRIAELKTDPAFQELLAYYVNQKEIIFSDTLERMKVVGLHALDELMRRLEEDPEGWSKTELRQLVDLLLVQSQAKAQTAVRTGGQGGEIQINIGFVTSRNAGDTSMIDVTPGLG